MEGGDGRNAKTRKGERATLAGEARGAFVSETGLTLRKLEAGRMSGESRGREGGQEEGGREDQFSTRLDGLNGISKSESAMASAGGAVRSSRR